MKIICKKKHSKGRHLLKFYVVVRFENVNRHNSPHAQGQRRVILKIYHLISIPSSLLKMYGGCMFDQVAL